MHVTLTLRVYHVAIIQIPNPFAFVKLNYENSHKFKSTFKNSTLSTPTRHPRCRNFRGTTVLNIFLALLIVTLFPLIQISLSIHHISIALSHCTSKMRRARESGVIPHTLLMLLSPLIAALGTSLSILVSSCITIDEVLCCDQLIHCDNVCFSVSQLFVSSQFCCIERNFH